MHEESTKVFNLISIYSVAIRIVPGMVRYVNIKMLKVLYFAVQSKNTNIYLYFLATQYCIQYDTVYTTAGIAKTTYDYTIPVILNGNNNMQYRIYTVHHEGVRNQRTKCWWTGCYAVYWDYRGKEDSRIWPEDMFYSEGPLGPVPVSLCTQRDWKQVPVPFLLASRKGLDTNSSHASQQNLRFTERSKRIYTVKHLQNEV